VHQALLFMGSFEQIFSSICKYLLTKLNVNVTLHKDLSSLLEKICSEQTLIRLKQEKSMVIAIL